MIQMMGDNRRNENDITLIRPNKDGSQALFMFDSKRQQGTLDSIASLISYY